MRIQIILDKSKYTLTIWDTDIGITKSDLVNNLVSTNASRRRQEA
jgi:HSP90 family molecular chaperone